MRINLKINKEQFLGWKGYVFALATVALATWLKLLAEPKIIPANIPILYILAISFTATFFGLGPALLCSILSLLAYNFFFIPPVHTLTVSIDQVPITLVFLVVSIIISYLSASLREKTDEAKKEVAIRKQKEAELISYREHLEELVKEQTARNSAILASLVVGVGIYDRSGKLLSLNTIGREILGYSQSDLDISIGERITKIRAENPDGKPIPPEGSIPARALRGEIVRNYIFRMHAESGEIRWMLGDGSPILAENGEITGAVLTIVEITEQKKAEEQLGRLNRELRAISDCNQAIVRATDESALLTEVCRIMCEAVGYRMAWIGLVEHDAARTVRPVAWGGFEDGYLTTANITWSDTPRGQGPTGIAIRTGKLSFFQDFASELKAAPWREAALARGYRSSIAIPLKDATGNVFAVFGLYAGQPNGFNPKEVDLLEELVGDVAFGVNALRERIERRGAEEKLRETRDYLDNLITYTNAPIIVWDTDLRITRFNHAFERLTGQSAEEVVGKKLDILFPADSHDESMEHIRSATSGERWEVVEIPIKHKDGQVYILLWNSANIYGKDGSTVIATIAQGQDITRRKQAELELQKARDELEMRVQERTRELGKVNRALNAERQRFDDVLESLPVYVVLLAPDYHVPFANRFFRERFGQSQGKRCYEYLFNRTTPCENCETFKVLKTNAPHHWEWTGPDNRNYDISDFPFTDVDGSPLIMEVGIDITGQKRAQAELHKAHAELEMRVEERTRELRETRDYLDNLFNYANAPIIVWNPEFEITRFNHAFERLTGYTAAEVMGKKLDILFAADSHDESMEHIHEATSGERWEVVEIPIKHKDGTIRILLWNSANMYSPDGGTVIATIAQGQDITERKESEERERQAAREWQTTFDSIADLVSIQDRDFKLVRVNRAYADAVGMSQQELQGKPCYAVIHGLECPIEDCPHRETVATRKTVTREIFEPRLGIYCEVTTSPVFDRDGELTGSVHIVRDITERKKVEQMKDEFISLVSHELRTPMTVINGSLRTATTPGISPADKNLLLQNAIEGAEALSAILENLLELSRYQTGRLQLHKQPVNIPDIARDVIVKLQVQNVGRVFLTDFPDGLPPADADPIRVERILYNLLENAAKYSPETTEIKVSVRREDQMIITGVVDKGTGISYEDQGRLFELFERLGRGTRSKGLGLGLVVCKRLVEAQGGSIWVESAVGKGSTFYFTMPVRQKT